MQLRNKYFSYPVIMENTNYYVDSQFRTDVEQEIDGFNVRLNLTAELVNKELEGMLENGLISIIHHIECPQTCYRKIKKTQNYSQEYVLRNKDINGLVQVCSFLVANEDIPEYSNELFSSDYKGFRFNLEKGCILAVGNQTNLKINKNKDELENTSSIFSIVPNFDPLITEVQVNMFEQKIIISVPSKSYYIYYNTSALLEIQPIMHSMLILPALISTLNVIKTDRAQLFNYEDYRWYKSLKKVCGNLNIEFTEDGLANIDVFMISQKLLDSPIIRAMNYFGGDDNED